MTGGQITCDALGCQQVKRQTNHWWIAYEYKNGLLIEPWNEEIARIWPDVKHLCGMSCAQKLLSEWMESKICLTTSNTKD